MASAAHAALIGNFRPGFAPFVNAGEIIDQHGKGGKLSFDFAFQTRWEMTIGAGDMVVRGVKPTGIIGFHVVAGIAKFWGGGHFNGNHQKGYQ